MLRISKIAALSSVVDVPTPLAKIAAASANPGASEYRLFVEHPFASFSQPRMGGRNCRLRQQTGTRQRLDAKRQKSASQSEKDALALQRAEARPRSTEGKHTSGSEPDSSLPSATLPTRK
jgi:hypothetical protein